MGHLGLKLSVVVPVFNEANFLIEILARICSAPLSFQIEKCEVIVIDDCSNDGSREWLQSVGSDFQSFFRHWIKRPTEFKLIFQDFNQGKGAAVRRGIECSTGDIVLIQDADLEYNPLDYPKLLSPIIAGNADVVLGSRFLGSEQKVLFFWHRFVNNLLTRFLNLLCDMTFTDIETCYKAMTGDLARSLRLTSQRFGIEPEIVIRVSQARVRVFEVGVSYNGRTYEEGKKIGPADGLAALFHILRYSLFGGSPFKNPHVHGKDYFKKLNPPQFLTESLVNVGTGPHFKRAEKQVS